MDNRIGRTKYFAPRFSSPAEKVHILPVYEGGKLVGVIRDTDLFLAMVEAIAFE